MLDGAFSKLEKPKDYHSDQATCYGYLWNEEHPEDPVTAITFIYVCKDGAELETPFKLFTLPLSDRRWERLQAKFAAIWRAIDEGELPNRDHDPYSQFSPCRFCPYLAVCVETDTPPEEDDVSPDFDEDEEE
jgi:CRISPR/Cas system-associated exonuclease Cas4 (RecB family)